MVRILTPILNSNHQNVLDVPASWRIVPFWHSVCAVKMPPRSLINSTTITESKLWYWPLWVERFKSVAPTTTPNNLVGRGQVCRDAFVNTIKCGIAPLCIAKSCTSRGVSGACSKTPVALTHRMRAAFACVTLRFRSSKVQNSDVAPWLKGLPCIRTLEQGCMSVLSLSAHPRGSPWGCGDCLSQLQLSSPLIVGFKLTYVLA